MPIRTATVQNKQKGSNKCWRGCGEFGTLVHYWWECKIVLPLQKIWRSLKNIKNRTRIKYTVIPINLKGLNLPIKRKRIVTKRGLVNYGTSVKKNEAILHPLT